MNIYQKYLDFLLWLKLPHVAFAVSERWAKSKDESRATVALKLQFHLVDHYGYHECPHCHGATRVELEHISNPAHPCSITCRDLALIDAFKKCFVQGFRQFYSAMDIHPTEHEPPRPTIH